MKSIILSLFLRASSCEFVVNKIISDNPRHPWFLSCLCVFVSLWPWVNYAKQTQFQNGQYDHKYSKNKGLCQRTTNNQQRTLFKTNPIKANFKRSKPSQSQIKANFNRKNTLPSLPAETLPRPPRGLGPGSLAMMSLHRFPRSVLSVAMTRGLSIPPSGEAATQAMWPGSAFTFSKWYYSVLSSGGEGAAGRVADVFFSRVASCIPQVLVDCGGVGLSA